MVWAIVGGIAAAVLLACMLLSAATSRRCWPPGDRDHRWYLYWTLATVNTVSLLAGLTSAVNAGALAGGAQFVTGSILALAGFGIAVQAIRQLHLTETTGLPGRLRTEGLYAYSRNPQVVGNILTLLGVTLAAPLPRLQLLAGLTALWLAAMPFAEEPWLQDQYGDEYSRYREQVPRFVPVIPRRS